MTQSEIERKQYIVCKFLQDMVDKYSTDNWKVKAEYSTNDNDKRVIVVQEQAGDKEVFYGNVTPLWNYYSIDIFGLTIQECKNLSLLFGNLIGTNNVVDDGNVKWQIMFKQFTNPQTLEYQDLRRVSYNMTMQCVVGIIYRKEV